METIKVLRIDPLESPKVIEIENTLKAKQAIVGGYIEVLCPFEDENIAVVCNEEGKLEGLPLNRALRDEDGDVMDIIAGTFFLAGTNDEGEFVSLTADEIAKYSEMYKYGEIWFSDKERSIKQ